MSKKFVYDGRKDMTKKAYKELQKRNRVVVDIEYRYYYYENSKKSFPPRK